MNLACSALSYSLSLEGKDSLPLCGAEDGTYDMTVLLLLHVVREMCRVPDHNVLVANTLPVVEAAYVGGGVRLGCSRLARGGGYPVVDLAIVEPQDPHIGAPEGVRDAVVWARDQVVGVAGLRVPDLPPSVEVRPSATRGLEPVGVPVVRGKMGGELNSRTTLFSLVPMSKSNLQ